jgi:integrase
MRRAPGQANIEEHPKGSGRYRVRVRTGGKLKTIASGLTYAQAVTTASAYIEVRNTEVLREGVTLAQFGVGFLNRRERQGVRGIKQERGRWSKYVGEMPIGQLPVASLGRRDIVDWRDALIERGLADQTVKNGLNLLRAALTDAVDRELLQANPARDVKVRSSGTSKEDLSGVLRPPEQVALLQACSDRDRPVVLFALLTGLRLSEQWWLRWEDVRGDHVLVRRSVDGKAPKSGKPRRVPLLEPARELLAALPRDAEWVFPGARGGRRDYGKHPRGWSAALKGLGRHIRWHDLRHTCATSLLAGWWGRQWSLEEVRGFMGHSTVQVTERYARILDESVADAAAATRLFPASSQPGGLRMLQVSEKIESQLCDLNARPTVYECVEESSNYADLDCPEFPIGNESSQTFPVDVWALAEAANRLLRKAAA